ncbi:hypothetical protein JCM10212_004914 [Sporobolomyces blumeae]
MSGYRFPRSQGSIDLTDPATLPPPSSASAPQLHQQPRPSFVITNATPQDALPRSATDQQHLARMTSATRTLLSQPPSSQHLSSGYSVSGKALSRISEYSESAYSADGSSRPNSHEPERMSQPFGLSPSASTSTNDSSNPDGPTPTTMSFSFPNPPAAYSSSPPAPTIPLPHPPPNARLTVVSPTPGAYAALPGSPSRSHLPSRPITALTTPLPSSNPQPLPVPISNFANPAGEDRSLSPAYARNGSRDSVQGWAGGSAQSYPDTAMVQLPGRAVTSNPRASYHHSQPSDSTAWTADEKYSIDADKDPFAAAYDAVSLAPSSASNPRGGESNPRFTLDNNEKSPSRLGSFVPVKRGANRKLAWCFAILAIVGIAVGLGVGLGMKNVNRKQEQDAAQAKGSSSTASLSQTVVLPESTASSSIEFRSPSSDSKSATRTVAAAADATETFSTTFGYQIGSLTTVVPLTYTIPTSYFTREDGRIQFTEEVVLPSLERAGGSFTSDLRFRVQPTDSPSAGTGTASTAQSTEPGVSKKRRRAKRDLDVDERGTALHTHQERRARMRSIR